MGSVVEKLAASGHLTGEQVERVGTRVQSFMEELRGDPALMEKAAKSMGFMEAAMPALKTLGFGAGVGIGAGALSLGAGAIGDAIGKHRDSIDKAKHYKEMIEVNPELADSNADATMVQRHFNTLHKFNPEYASDPVVAGTYVQNALEFSRPNIEAINNLVNARKNLAQSKPQSMLPGMVGAGVGEATTTFAKQLTGQD